MNPEFADTNLFLRYLTNDVPAQADAVERLFRRAARGEWALITDNMKLTERGLFNLTNDPLETTPLKRARIGPPTEPWMRFEQHFFDEPPI